MTTDMNEQGLVGTDDWQYKEIRSVAERAKIPDEKVKPILDWIWPVYWQYDMRAVKAQRRFRCGAMTVYALSALAVVVAIGQFLFMPAIPQVVALEVLAMIAALTLLIVSHRRQWKRDWLTNRYVAEQLRIRMYLAVVPRQANGLSHGGAATDPSKALPFYSQLGVKLPADVEETVRHVSLAACVVEELPKLKTWLGQGWIGSQARFHKGAADRNQRATRRARWATIALFSVTLIVAILHTFGVGHGCSSDGHLRCSLATSAMLLLSIALPAIASAVHAINDLLDHERIAARSDGMARILDGLAQDVQNAKTIEEVLEVAQRTEQVMAIENFEWMAALAFRKQPHAPA